MYALITTQSAQLSYVLCYATTLQVIWFYYYQIVIVLAMIFYLFDTIIVGYNLFIEQSSRFQVTLVSQNLLMFSMFLSCMFNRLLCFQCKCCIYVIWLWSKSKKELECPKFAFQKTLFVQLIVLVYFYYIIRKQYS